MRNQKDFFLTGSDLPRLSTDELIMNRNSRLELGTLENWLWEAACVIRGPIDAPKFKDYILPLVFLKRLSDVFEDELQQLGGTVKYVVLHSK